MASRLIQLPNGQWAESDAIVTVGAYQKRATEQDSEPSWFVEIVLKDAKVLQFPSPDEQLAKKVRDDFANRVNKVRGH